MHKRLIRFEGGRGGKRGSKSNDSRRFAVIDQLNKGVVKQLEASGSSWKSRSGPAPTPPRGRSDQSIQPRFTHS